MSIEADIKTALDAHAGLTALISTRSYANRLPQKPTYPNIVYSRIITNPGNVVGSRNNQTNAHFQFEIRAATVASMNSVAQQLKTCLEDSATITAVFLDEQDQNYEDDVKVFRKDVDFSTWFIDT